METARILIVEDEAVVALDLKMRLSRMGYAIIGTAADGTRAIDLAAADPPDLILMDINIKGKINGIETARRIIEQRSVPVVFLTAHSDQDTLSQAKAANPYGYLVKPFDEKSLHTTIEMAVYKHHMERQLQREEQKLRASETEQQCLKVQLLQAQKAESLARMAGAIAHHFNNQLQAVMGNLEMAIDDLPPGLDLLDTLSEAMKASRKAAEVSMLMLTYLGQTPDNQEPMDLSEVCRQNLPLIQAAAPKGMTLQAVFPASGPIIRASAGQIQQVLTNLLTNARESISGNQYTISLTVKTVPHVDIPASKRFPLDWQPQEIAYACLEISDTGCGISNKDMEKIFDPFFTTKFTGRGLGLPVVMGIVKSHGGGISVESEPGRGSTFRVFLPVSTEVLPCRHDLPAMPKAKQAVAAKKLSKLEEDGSVLLIEDEPQVRNMAKIMLTRLGYKVLEAKDGVEALEIFQQHQDEIRCVLSDLTMPRMDGWETLTALRKLSPNIPVVLSSGYDEAKVMAEAHNEQPNAFLGKPYRLKDLYETIRQVLARENTRSSLVKVVEEVSSLPSF